MNYTVDNLLEKLSVVGNNTIWKKVSDGVTVKGVVSNVTVYEKRSYFDLIGSGKKIRACCSVNDTPSEGASIEFNGIVTLKINEFGTNLQVMINGSPVGEWQPFNKDNLLLTSDDLVKYNNQPLSSLIGRFNEGKLLLVGSKTAIGDIRSSLNTDSFVKFEAYPLLVSKKMEALNILKDIKGDVKQVGDLFPAFAVVRGGDDETMGVWDDPVVVRALLDVNIPFFAALGHSHRVTLADKYAAQAFPTPGNFASSLNNEVDSYL